ncbi:translation initiation factor IF-2-like [Catharus ustulatus]|uniref:translation initiation factor IF-2-like n=1 Tax=Catharus ustulatus TaxID=91951 RepID=UPI00140CE444|nr:translation initiation factor IF-2-like [Catharus ustulatus]
MRPGKGRPQEAEDVQPPPPDHSTEPDPAPTPPQDAEQPPAQGAEDEAVARELEQLYLSHLRRLRGDPGDSDPPPRNGGPPFPERAPNTSLANEMALRYEGGGRCSPPVLLGRGGAGGGSAGGAGAAPPGEGEQFGGCPEGVRGGSGLGRAGPGGLGGRGGSHGRAGLGALPGAGLAHVKLGGGDKTQMSPPKIVTSQIVTALSPPPISPWRKALDTPKSIGGGGEAELRWKGTPELSPTTLGGVGALSLCGTPPPTPTHVHPTRVLGRPCVHTAMERRCPRVLVMGGALGEKSLSSLGDIVWESQPL